MTAINHALTGTAIGLIVGRPELALPLALASHFICDAIPHFGTPNPKKDIKTNAFRNYLLLEALLCFLVVAALAIIRPDHWQLAIACAFLAAAPDLLSANRYFSAVRGKRWKPGWYARFASGIQWFEKPIGAVVEVAWFIGAVIIVLPFIR